MVVVAAEGRPPLQADGAEVHGLSADWLVSASNSSRMVRLKFLYMRYKKDCTPRHFELNKCCLNTGLLSSYNFLRATKLNLEGRAFANYIF